MTGRSATSKHWAGSMPRSPRSNHLGRVAWQAADLPQILPVTYATHQGSVYFRTTPDGILSELAQPTRVRLRWTSSTSRHGAAEHRAAWTDQRGERTRCRGRSVGCGLPGPMGGGKSDFVHLHPPRPRLRPGRTSNVTAEAAVDSGRLAVDIPLVVICLWTWRLRAATATRDLRTRWIPTGIHGCPLSC